MTNVWESHPELVEQLRALWAEGLSCSQIARALGHGISRNAAIGKVARMGLPGRVTVTRKQRAYDPAPARPRLVIPTEPPAPVTFIGPIGDFPPPGTCRFIQGDVSHPNWRSCGNPVAKTGSSWCSTDARRFLQASYRGNGCRQIQQGAGMNKPVPEKPTLPPDPDDVPMAPSVGQIMEQHMAEIIGPEAAARYRKGKEGAE